MPIPSDEEFFEAFRAMDVGSLRRRRHNGMFLVKLLDTGGDIESQVAKEILLHQVELIDRVLLEKGATPEAQTVGLNTLKFEASVPS